MSDLDAYYRAAASSLRRGAFRQFSREWEYRHLPPQGRLDGELLAAHQLLLSGVISFPQYQEATEAARERYLAALEQSPEPGQEEEW